MPAHRLRLLEGYELKPETNQSWLQKGIQFERLVLNRKEFQGPAVQLTVFREHMPGPLRIGRVTPHRRA